LSVTVLSTAVAPRTPEQVVGDFLSPYASLNEVNELTQSFTPREAIAALRDALEHDDHFRNDARARRLAYDALSRIGELDDSGKLVYKDKEQIHIILTAIKEQDPAALPVLVRKAYLVDQQFYPEAVEALAPLLNAKRPGIVQESAFAMSQIGLAAQPALAALHDLLLDPASANPEAWKLLTQLPPADDDRQDPWRDELIARFKSGEPQVAFLTSIAAARVRIAPEALLADLDIYTQSSLLNRVGVRVLYSLSIGTDAPLLDDEAAQRKAAPFVCSVAQRTTVDQDRRWAVGIVEHILRSKTVHDSLKVYWRTQTLNAAINTTNAEAKRMLQTVVSTN